MAGAQPGYSKLHIIRAILYLSQGRMSRHSLVSALGITESSVKTMLKHFKKEGIADSSRAGHILTKKGYSIADTYLKKFSRPKEIFTTYVEGKKSIIRVFNTENKITITNGVKERDIAVMNGANGAIVLVFKNRKLHFPNDIMEVDKELEKSVYSADGGLSDHDIVIIVFAYNYSDAENGAIACAISLTGKTLGVNPIPFS